MLIILFLVSHHGILEWCSTQQTIKKHHSNTTDKYQPLLLVKLPLFAHNQYCSVALQTLNICSMKHVSTNCLWKPLEILTVCVIF